MTVSLPSATEWRITTTGSTGSMIDVKCKIRIKNSIWGKSIWEDNIAIGVTCSSPEHYSGDHIKNEMGQVCDFK
jgi:hypothetical protein